MNKPQIRASIEGSVKSAGVANGIAHSSVWNGVKHSVRLNVGEDVGDAVEFDSLAIRISIHSGLDNKISNKTIANVLASLKKAANE